MGSEMGSASTPIVAPTPVVIALIDTGLSPYYPLYSVGDDSFVARAVPVPMTRVRVAPPDSREDPFARDDPFWKTLEPSVLYHFEGTRLIGTSVDTQRDYPYVRDANFHGAGTTYIAAREAPEAIIVSIQASGGMCVQDANASCFARIPVATAMEWAAAQPWIDIISVSVGYFAHADGDPRVHEDVDRYLRASENAAHQGKLIVQAAGNDPNPSIRDHRGGPPWVITVGGFTGETQGETVQASKLVDVVANFTDYSPYYGAGEMYNNSGTSFGTPIVAGTLARALGIIRQQDPARVVSPQELRDALNASARLVAPTDWQPVVPPVSTDPGEISEGVIRYASAPVLLPTQLGWGYVDSSLADEIARRVLEGDDAIPPEKGTIARSQAAWQGAREAYWDAYK